MEDGDEAPRGPIRIRRLDGRVETLSPGDGRRAAADGEPEDDELARALAMSLEGAEPQHVELAGMTGGGGGTERPEQVASLSEMTGASLDVAREMLQAHSWSLDDAVSAFFADPAPLAAGAVPAMVEDGRGAAAPDEEDERELGRAGDQLSAAAVAAAAAQPEPEGDNIDQILSSARKVDPRKEREDKRAKAGAKAKWAGKGFSMKEPEPEPLVTPSTIVGGLEGAEGLRHRRHPAGGGVAHRSRLLQGPGTGPGTQAAAAAAAAAAQEEGGQDTELVPRDVTIVFWKDGFTVRDKPGEPPDTSDEADLASGETRIVDGAVVAAKARRGLATLGSGSRGAASPPPPLRRYGDPENEQFIADVKSAANG